MNVNVAVITCLLSAFASTSFVSTADAANSLQLDEATRAPLIKRALVWVQPPWIDNTFNFTDTFNPADAPTETPDEAALTSSSIDCTFLYEAPTGPVGDNPKFKCKTNTQPELKLKVKYGANNGEVRGEVLSTRLLWALGFGADRMFFMRTTNCFGCSENPVKQTETDPASASIPVAFSPSAIERKAKGTEVLKVVPAPNGKTRLSQGWGFEELQNVDAPEQLREREALKLIAVFINHLDNRKANQRLLCLDGETAQGCTGKTAMIIHDVGSTFGGGYKKEINDLSKVDFEEWSKKTIWDDPASCTASVSEWGSQNMKSTKVSEEGRQFLLNLLKGFAYGTLGRMRVENLFNAVDIKERGGHTPSEWTDVFLRKIKEIEFPMGNVQDTFVCPPL